MKQKKTFFLGKRQWGSLASLVNPKPTNSSATQVAQILAHCRSGALSPALLLLNSVDPNAVTNKPLLFASLLQTCTKVKSFDRGVSLHAHLVKSGLETDRFVGNSLLSLYFKLCPEFRDTKRVFDGLFYRDVITWTCMVTGYVRAGRPRESVGVFVEMLGLGIEPNEFALSAVIKACSDVRDLRGGRAFHGMVVSRGFECNCVISGALVDFYGRNYAIGEARKVFDEISEPDEICWMTIASACTRNEEYNKALEIFYFALRKGVCLLDEFTFGTVMTACGNLGRLKQGKEMHAKVIVSGFSGNVIVGSSLVDMYGKLGLPGNAQRVFDRMNTRNSVSWSALLDSYRQNEDLESVLRVFREANEFDLYSYGTVIQACAGLAAVRQGKEVHCHYVRRGGQGDLIVESALIGLYAKCGCVNFAYRVFVQMPDRNLITWNSMISGFAQNGRPLDALRIYNAMIQEGTMPDNISFLGVLFACSHSGLVDQGRKLFTSMTEEYGIKPGIEHYNCMVDLLGRAGLLEEAESLINDGKCNSNSSLWVILLGACTSSGNSAAAELIAKKTMESKPNCHLSYIYLSNMYRALGRWGDAVKIRRLMHERGVRKLPGTSWIDTKSNDSLQFPAPTHICIEGF